VKLYVVPWIPRLDVTDSPVHDSPLYEKLLPSCSMSCRKALRILTVKLQCSGAVYVSLPVSHDIGSSACSLIAIKISDHEVSFIV
jgi:hypothetical protein